MPCLTSRSLIEAVIRPDEGTVALALDLLRRRLPVAELNRQLNPRGIRFDLADTELAAANVPARVGLDGVVFNRVPKSPSDLRWFERVLRHELIHVGQLDRARQTGDAERMYRSDHARLLNPDGSIDPKAYEDNPQETMAAAHDTVERLRRAGMTDADILQVLQTQPCPRGETSKARFLRYAVQYLQRQ